MNKQHKCLKSTSEVENDNIFSFLDVKITRHNQHFKRPAYRKPTFNGVFTHYENYLDQSFNLLYFTAFRFALTTLYFIWK